MNEYISARGYNAIIIDNNGGHYAENIQGYLFEDFNSGQLYVYKLFKESTEIFKVMNKFLPYPYSDIIK